MTSVVAALAPGPSGVDPKSMTAPSGSVHLQLVKRLAVQGLAAGVLAGWSKKRERTSRSHLAVFQIVAGKLHRRRVAVEALEQAPLLPSNNEPVLGVRLRLGLWISMGMARCVVGKRPGEAEGLQAPDRLLAAIASAQRATISRGRGLRPRLLDDLAEIQ